MEHSKYRRGDKVVFCKSKSSTRPGPRAKNIDPARHGETYSYQVDKFWVVEDVHDGKVRLVTPGGKHHTLDAADPNLRHARWWEKIFYRKRFEKILNEVLPA